MPHSSPSTSSDLATPSGPPAAEQSQFVRDLRRTIAIIIVVAFSVAAIGGISVMLGDIETEAAFQVIATTAVTGACSVAAFCGATLIGRRAQWFGSVTILLAFVTLLVSIVFIWGDPYAWEGPVPGDPGMTLGDIFYQALSSIVLVTAVASVSSLILLLVPRSWVVRIGLPITLGLLSLGTCLVLFTIWMEDAWEYDWLTRLNGIVWILAALGVVVVPLTSVLLKAGSKPAAVSAAPSAPERAGSTVSQSTRSPATLSHATLELLEAAARSEGITADELVDRLLATGSLGGADDSAAGPQSDHPRH